MKLAAFVNGAATVTAMLGELWGYFAHFGDQWLLACMGSLILLLDIWVIGEGVRVRLAEPAGLEAAPAPD